MGKLAIYGIVHGKFTADIPRAKIYASQVFKALSGRFVVFDYGDGYWKAATNGENTLGGYVEWVGTASSTSGVTILPVCTKLDNTYELPFYNAGTNVLTQALFDAVHGRNIDLYVASNVQYADASATNDGVLIVKDCDINRNTLICQINPAKFAPVS